MNVFGNVLQENVYTFADNRLNYPAIKIFYYISKSFIHFTFSSTAEFFLLNCLLQ